ncbi:neocarzinostatin apoprotein domain-containing protein [Oerskovia turbata]
MTSTATVGKVRTKVAAALVALLAVVGLSLATAQPAHAAGTLTVSKTSGLGTETVNVSGTGYSPNVSLYVSLCSTATPIPGDACDQDSYAVVTTDSTGAFTAVGIPVQKTWAGWSGRPGSTPPASVTCKGGATDSQCAIQTSRVGAGFLDVSSTNVSFS